MTSKIEKLGDSTLFNVCVLALQTGLFVYVFIDGTTFSSTVPVRILFWTTLMLFGYQIYRVGYLLKRDLTKS